MLVEGAAGDAGQLGDPSGGDAAVALLGERRRRGLEQAQALVRPDQVGRDAVAAGGRRSGGTASGLGRLGEGGAGDQAQLGHLSASRSSRARSRSSSDARPLEGGFGLLVAEVGAGGEVHQLGQGVPEAARVAGAERLADAGLDPADDEDAGRLRRRRRPGRSRRGRCRSPRRAARPPPRAGPAPARRRSAPRRRAPGRSPAAR